MFWIKLYIKKTRLSIKYNTVELENFVLFRPLSFKIQYKIKAFWYIIFYCFVFLRAIEIVVIFVLLFYRKRNRHWNTPFQCTCTKDNMSSYWTAVRRKNNCYNVKYKSLLYYLVLFFNDNFMNDKTDELQISSLSAQKHYLT